MENNKDPYEILGVSKNASKDDIKKAFKKQSMTLHPDRGGDHNEFTELKEAYEAALNGGHTKKPDNSHVAAMQQLADMFSQIIEGEGDRIFHIDVVGLVRKTAENHKRQFTNELKTIEKTIKRLSKLKTRMKVKKGSNIFEGVVAQKLRDCERSREIKQKNVTLAEDILKIIEDYEYDREVQNQVNGFLEMYTTTASL